MGGLTVTHLGENGLEKSIMIGFLSCLVHSLAKTRKKVLTILDSNQSFSIFMKFVHGERIISIFSSFILNLGLITIEKKMSKMTLIF